MPRATNNPASRKRKNKTFKRAKGFWGGRGKLLRTAQETVARALRYSTRDRKVRKREFRYLWNVRINAACRALGFSYSSFIDALKKANVDLNRKSLAEIAARDSESFKKIADLVAPKKKKVPAAAAK